MRFRTRPMQTSVGAEITSGQKFFAAYITAVKSVQCGLDAVNWGTPAFGAGLWGIPVLGAGHWGTPALDAFHRGLQWGCSGSVYRGLHSVH